MKLKPYQQDEFLACAELEAQDRARRGILAFTLYTKDDYEVNWHHRKLAAKLNAWIRGEIQYLMVFMPPRHGKSELISMRLPAFIHGLYPNSEIMAASYLDSLASDMTKGTQAIIDSAAYRTLFPNTAIVPSGTSYTKGTRNSTEHTIIGTPKGKYRGQGVGGSFTGKGANWVLVDDPIKGREIADSVAFRDRLWNFYLNDLFSRLETNLKTGRRGQVLITLTRWHEDDLAGRLIALMKSNPLAPQWDIVRYPAIRVDMDDPTDPRQIGEALWPRKYNLDALAEIKASLFADGGPRAWSSLYQQDPIPDGGGLFSSDMFEFGEMPEEFDWSFITADTSYKGKQENDFTVFTSVGVIGEQIFIRDVFRRQIKASEAEDLVTPFILTFSTSYGYRGTWIEPKGHGIYLNQAFAAKRSILIPSELDLKEFYSDRRLDKVQRANSAVPHLANRKIIINKNLSNKEELVSECLHFPTGKHDDFVDTLVDAIKMVFSRTVGILDVL